MGQERLDYEDHDLPPPRRVPRLAAVAIVLIGVLVAGGLLAVVGLIAFLVWFFSGFDAMN